jgi:DNA-binding LacI/PurR family transcriptional regulator
MNQAIKERTVTKTSFISDSIRSAIRNHEWKPGDKLPTVRKLAEDFSVTVVTIGRALDELEKEHLIHRVQGRGVFVSEPITTSDSTTVGAMMLTRGHTFSNIFSTLVDELADHGLSVMATDLECAVDGRDQSAEERVRRALQTDMRALIIDGMVDFPFNTITPNGSTPPITFIHRYETTRHLPKANRILSNYNMGGRMATEFLLEKGARKLLFLTLSEAAFKREHKSRDCSLAHQFSDGVTDAMAAAGLAPDDLTSVYDSADNTDSNIEAALRDGVDGVICMGDNRASRVYRIAETLGLDIGRDVKVIGYYDTPWCSALTPHLTSISIQEDRLAQRAVQAVHDGLEGEWVWVPPVIVERESTG